MRCLWERYEDVVPAYGGRESGGVPATARAEANADRDNGVRPVPRQACAGRRGEG
jgi:hypothetical protein